MLLDRFAIAQTQEAHLCVIKVGLDSIDMSTMRGREDRAIAKLATCLHKERQRAGRREGRLRLNRNHVIVYCVLTCHVFVFDLLSQTSSCLPLLPHLLNMFRNVASVMYSSCFLCYSLPSVVSCVCLVASVMYSSCFLCYSLPSVVSCVFLV